MEIKNIFAFLTVILIICPLSKSTFSWPDLSKTSGYLETYTIDFRVLDSARGTYWCLANYYLGDDELAKEEPTVGGGAYGGFQILSNGTRVLIISLWDIYYVENGVKKTMHLKRVYPGNDQEFTGSEGEGTTLRDYYDWKDGNWYRYVIHTWNMTLSNTYIGNWVQDLSTKEWTLFAYFDVGFEHSNIYPL